MFSNKSKHILTFQLQIDNKSLHIITTHTLVRCDYYFLYFVKKSFGKIYLQTQRERPASINLPRFVTFKTFVRLLADIFLSFWYKLTFTSSSSSYSSPHSATLLRDFCPARPAWRVYGGGWVQLWNSDFLRVSGIHDQCCAGVFSHYKTWFAENAILIHTGFFSALYFILIFYPPNVWLCKWKTLRTAKTMKNTTNIYTSQK